MCLVDGIIRIHQHLNTVDHLFFIGIIEFLKCLHRGDILCWKTQQFTLVHTAFKYKLQRSAHIEECCIVPSICLAHDLWLHAADDAVVACFSQSQTTV